MTKKGFYYSLILILIIALSGYLVCIYKPKETPIAKSIPDYDYNQDGRKDFSLVSDNKAFVFLDTSSGYALALYIKNSSGEWVPLAKRDNFVAIEDRSKEHQISAENFDFVSQASSDFISATSKIVAPDGNPYKVTLNVKTEIWDGKMVFSCEYHWQNKGRKDSPEVTIPVAFNLGQNVKRSYYFSPGIFYKNNELIPKGAGTDVNIPRLSKMIKDGYYTFLANRPMLPVMANWENGKMVMLGTVDTIKIGQKKVRNSMGWHIGENGLEQRVWTHGYLYNRYIGSDNWTEEIDRDTASKTDIGKGKSLSQRFYLAFDEGDLWTIYDYYRAFREHYRKGLEKRVYESMKSSFKTKTVHINDWYNEEKGYLLHCAEARDQLLISWIGGIPAGYGILLMSDLLKDEGLSEKSIKTIDFIVNNSLSPSGFSYNWYQNGEWSYMGVASHPQYRKGIPARVVSESTFYLLKAYQYELGKGKEYPGWLKHAISNLNAIVTVWNKSGEFGYEYSDKIPTIVQGDTPAGVLWIGALALGYEVTGKKEYLEVAEKAADYYYTHFLSKGLLYGGELDQDYSPDTSSSAQAMAAYCTLYETTRNEKYLTYAKKAADIYSTYIVGYNLLFDSYSINDQSIAGQKGWTSLGLSTSGTRNNHITSGCWPGFTEYLVDIYDKTGDVYYLHLASDQYQASLEGYARSEDDIVNVAGMGKVKTGYGFDWIVHSDFCGGMEEKIFWFGGLRHLGMFHQTYIPALNWIPSQKDYGNVIIDYKAREAVSLDSLVITKSLFKKNKIELKAYNAGTNDETYKFFIKNLPYGNYNVYRGRRRLTTLSITQKSPSVSFIIEQASKKTCDYIIVSEFE